MRLRIDRVSVQLLGALLVLGAGCDDAPVPGPSPLPPTALAPPAVAPGPPIRPALAPAPRSDPDQATDAGDAGTTDGGPSGEEMAAGPMITEQVVVQYLKFLKAYVPAGQAIIKRLHEQMQQASRHVAPRGKNNSVAIQQQTLANQSAASTALRTELGKDRDAAGLSYEQFQAVSLLAGEIQASKRKLKAMPLAAISTRSNDSRISPESRARMQGRLDQARTRAADLEAMTDERQQWGNSAVDTMVNHLDELLPLFDEKTKLDPFLQRFH